MNRGKYLNAKDLKLISTVLWGDICWTKLALKVNEDDEEYKRDLEKLSNLYCKINDISIDYLNEVYKYMDIFREYTHFKSFSPFSEFEEIVYIDKDYIESKKSVVTWSIEERSIFINDTFYPYGIDRKDVFIEFKKI